LPSNFSLTDRSLDQAFQKILNKLKEFSENNLARKDLLLDFPDDKKKEEVEKK